MADPLREFHCQLRMPAALDVEFDFRQDTPPGKDPDACSATLRRYHQYLWSKRLPSGVVFKLDTGTPRTYLHHRSDLGEFFLSSDSVIPSFRKERRLAPIFEQIPSGERDAFVRLTYTIGGMMIFPTNRIGREMTINQARGCHPKIKDRFDLTIECIRRQYMGQPNPLSDTLVRYSDFFRLFDSFKGYIEFFLLHDLVSEDYEAVRFFAEFDDFAGSPFPNTLDIYKGYCRRAAEFISHRNDRIAQWRDIT